MREHRAARQIDDGLVGEVELERQAFAAGTVVAVLGRTGEGNEIDGKGGVVSGSGNRLHGSHFPRSVASARK
ncbi:hypothetical protein D3C71_1778340 [compost metagenome]